MTEELSNTYKGREIAMASTPESLKYFEEFTFRPDDILIVTYPKSGTIWMKQITSLIQSGGDVPTTPNFEQVPWLEMPPTPDLNLEQRPSPRLLATHFAYDMMPSSFLEVKPKIIYVVRNPRDVFTSAYHFRDMAKLLSKPRSKEDFLHRFLSGEVGFGTWFDHVKGWLNAMDQCPSMTISYEELKMDLKDSLAKISQFMGNSLSSEAIEKIAYLCDFNNMKQSKTLNDSVLPDGILDTSKSFLRKGVCGDWKNFLTVADAEHFDAVYKKEMEDVKYEFVWE
ncbi:sulfotransferase 2B1-like [Diretmus argenteus]